MTSKKNSLIQTHTDADEFDNAYEETANYGKAAFWDDRYSNEIEPFEWYYPYAYFKSSINDYCEKTDTTVLVAGCGSSHMLIDLAEDGYQKIIAVDISRVAIQQQKVRCKNYPNIEFYQGTMVDTIYEDESIDMVIDKGLFDSLICNANGSVTIQQYIIEVERILKEKGVFFLVTHGNPEQRLQYLEQFDADEPHYTPWNIEVEAILKPRQFGEEALNPDDPDHLYFTYIAKKDKYMVRKKKVKAQKIKTEKLPTPRRGAPTL